MSTRPAPRRSSLAGSTPVGPSAATAAPTPDAERPPAETAPKATQGPATSPAEPTAGTAASKQGARKPKYPPKVSFYQDPEDTARVRGAILHTMTTEGSRNLTQFINRAVMAEVARLEAKYNNGEPFGPVGANELPQGRPMGE